MISSCIALGFGGFAAAWMAGIEIHIDGVMHRLITRSFATLLAVYLLSSTAGSVVRGGFSAVGSVTSAAGSSLGAMAKPLTQAAGISPDVIQEQAQAVQTAKDAADASPAAASTALFAAFGLLLLGGAAASVGGMMAVQRRTHAVRHVIR